MFQAGQRIEHDRWEWTCNAIRMHPAALTIGITRCDIFMPLSHVTTTQISFARSQYYDEPSTLYQDLMQPSQNSTSKLPYHLCISKHEEQPVPFSCSDMLAANGLEMLLLSRSQAVPSSAVSK
jgi:hypothetical protein